MMSMHPLPKHSAPVRVAIELDHDQARDQAQDRLKDRVVIRWNISRRALGDRAPGGVDPIVHLEVAIEPTMELVWMLIDPKSKARRVVELPEAFGSGSEKMKVVEIDQMILIDSPEILAHIERTTLGHAELKYVRTRIFDALNIAGGRYEPIGCLVGHQQD